jgi:alpha-galactosidase
MGNDIRTMKPSDLAILSNPAVIAINQDPAGTSAVRRRLHLVNATEDLPHLHLHTQMWSGNLQSTTGGTTKDMLVLLINGADTSTNMTATLAEIFVDDGPAGTAQQVSLSWEVRDLWADRMSDEQARWIMDNNSTAAVGMGRYNATKTSYAQGLANRDERLLGKVTMTVQPSGAITAAVEPHGARMFRLRAVETTMAKTEP